MIAAPTLPFYSAVHSQNLLLHLSHTQPLLFDPAPCHLLIAAGEEVLCGKADLAAVLRMLGGARGSPADRLRLAVLWMLATEGGGWEDVLCVPLISQVKDLHPGKRGKQR